jgi:hypothetical protein
MRNIGEKTPEWEIVDLLDGRFALQRKGIVLFVGYSPDECIKWLERRNRIHVTQSLEHAIRRL